MYAGTAFIIIDASANVLPRLGLPDWTVTFLIILLLVGFPISLILSWIFDLTPQGLEKTDRIEEDLKKEEVSQKTRRLFTLSNLIIAILLIVVCILLYPKLFNKDQFEDIRDKKGKISVAVMPFENLTGDSLNNVWQGGIQNLLISALSNSNELQVRRYQTMSNILAQKKNVNQASVSPSLAGELARDLETKTYILGKIMRAGKRIRINAQLVNANTEEIYKTYQADCTNEEAIFAVSDSLGGIIRNYLEIKKYSESIHSPGASSSAATNSPEAFGFYIHAYDSMEKQDARTTVELLQKAIETDPDFIDAYVFLSLYLTSLQQYKRAQAVFDRAYVKRDQVSVREKLFLDHLHAYHYETPYEEIMYLRQILEMDEMNASYWLFLGYAQSRLEQFEEAIASFDRVIEIQEQWGISNTYPQLYYWLGQALHKVGQHKRENEIYELGLQAGQFRGFILNLKSVCALSRDDDESAADYLEGHKAQRKAQGWSEALILNSIGYIYEEANRVEEAEKYKRRALALDPDDPQVLEGLAWHLIEYDIHLEEGMALIEKAMKLDPGGWNILDTWGRGLYKSGRYEEALQALHQAKELRGLYDPLIMGHINATEKALAVYNK
ncbi:MAG: tetratricopeptide repeat protein, partial [Candidatus Bathyarchaeota archaeon]|nr:tetratricopeptide repeat protein [Candidatus Bathyarchaeota archaeon]